MNARTRLSTTMLLGLLAPILAHGCGGGGAKQQTVSDFCKQLATAICQVTDACGPTLSKETCESTETTICMAGATNAMAGGVRVFTSANVGACVNMATSVYKQTAPITPTQHDSLVDACNYVFQGAVAKNMTCMTKYDCAGVVLCDKGVCAVSMT